MFRVSPDLCFIAVAATLTNTLTSGFIAHYAAADESPVLCGAAAARTALAFDLSARAQHRHHDDPQGTSLYHTQATLIRRAWVLSLFSYSDTFQWASNSPKAAAMALGRL